MKFSLDSQLQEALAFVNRTRSYGVPLRVALVRASNRFNIDKHLLSTVREVADAPE